MPIICLILIVGALIAQSNCYIFKAFLRRTGGGEALSPGFQTMLVVLGSLTALVLISIACAVGLSGLGDNHTTEYLAYGCALASVILSAGAWMAVWMMLRHWRFSPGIG